MGPLLIGYARVSRFGSDVDDQRAALLTRGVPPDRVYLDTGLTGMARPRPGLGEVPAACRAATPWSSPSWRGWPGQ